MDFEELVEAVQARVRQEPVVLRAVETRSMCQVWQMVQEGRGNPGHHVWGFPCPAFSAQRQKNCSTPGTGAPENHPTFPMSVGEFANYLSERQPSMFWMEEVVGFTKRVEALGMSPFAHVASKCRERGYAVEPLQLCHSVFINVRRPRVYLLGAHQRAGGVDTIA